MIFVFQAYRLTRNKGANGVLCVYVIPKCPPPLSRSTLVIECHRMAKAAQSRVRQIVNELSLF